MINLDNGINWEIREICHIYKNKLKKFLNLLTNRVKSSSIVNVVSTLLIRVLTKIVKIFEYQEKV